MQQHELLAQTQLLHKQGLHKDALALLENHLEQLTDPNRLELYLPLQNLYVSSLSIFGRSDEALQIAQAALQVSLQHLGEQHLLTANCYNSVGSALTNKGKYADSIVNYQKGMEICQAIESEEALLTVIKILNKICSSEIYLGNHSQAINYGKQSLATALGLPNTAVDTSIAYNLLGICFLETMDIDQAISYFSKALSLAIPLNNVSLMPALYNNLGNCYSQKQQYAEAIAYYQKALALYIDHFGDTNQRVANCYYNIGSLYTHTDTNQALPYLYKAIELYKQLWGDGAEELSALYNYVAACYFNQKQYEQTEQYRQKAIDIALDTVGFYHPDTVLLYSDVAKFYHHIGNYERALAHHQLALRAACPTFVPLDEYDNPPLADFVTDIRLFTLHEKAQTLYHYYQQTHHLRQLQASLQTYLLCDQLIQQKRQNYQAEGSRLQLATESKAMYADALPLLFDLHSQWGTLSKTPYFEHTTPPHHHAWHFVEQSKGVLLLLHLKDAEAQLQAKIDAPLLQQERHLQAQLRALDKEMAAYYQQAAEQRTQQQLEGIETQRFDAYQQYQALISRLEKSYPDYHRLKYNTQTIELNALQTQLQQYPSTAIVNYFVAANTLYVFCVLADECHLTATNLPENFSDLLADFCFYITEGAAERRNYLQTAYTLYQLLWQPIAQQLSAVQNVIIVPDGALANIPFEALLYQNMPATTRFADLPYLLLLHTISYHYSATLWANQTHTNTQTENTAPNTARFVGFAPVYAQDMPLAQDSPDKALHQHQQQYAANATRSVRIGNTEYQALLHSETEVNNIAHLFTTQGHSAQIYLHEQASEQNFRQYSANCQYVHIAAHSIYHNTQAELSSIVFSPNPNSTEPALLYLSDTYTLQLNANLVVLSCCETGIGAYAIGEGVMALHRGFLYSGAKNVIYTLFKVYDQSSSQLTTCLFEQILKGNNYAAALHQAKLAFLHTNKAPAHWAGFVLMGK